MKYAIGGLFIILFAFLGYRVFKSKKLHGFWKWVLLIFCIYFMVVGIAAVVIPAGASDSSSEESSESSSSESPKERHYRELNEAVDELPKKYEIITSASIDENAGTVVIVLDDSVLNTTSVQLQNIVKKAWGIGNNLVERNKPYPSDKDIIGTRVEDSAGNKLGHSSVLGDFKFDAK